MRPRLSARLLFAGIGAIACLLAALMLERVFASTHTSRWVDDHETPVLLFFSHYRNETERRLQEANANSGDVEVILTWNNLNDLDLHCVDPAGEEIFYGHRISDRTGGALDVDRNAGPPYTRQPVEHIYWPHGRAPNGRYRVYVQHYARHGGLDPTPFQVTVKNHGRISRYSGSISHDFLQFPGSGPGKLICEFTAAPSGFFAGLPAGFWRSLFVLGAWAAALTAALSAAFLGGLTLFYRRVYRRRFLPSATMLRLTGGSALWGAFAGTFTQAVYGLLPALWISLHPTWTHVIGLGFLAGMLGLVLGGRIPHLARGWAFLAGVIGGAAAGEIFLQVYWFGSEWGGRVAAAVTIGAIIGLAIALIVEEPEEPEEIGDDSFDGMQPLSLRANRIGPTGKLRRTSRETVNR